MVDELRTELHPDFAAALEEMQRLGIPGSSQVSPEGARQVLEDAARQAGVYDDQEPVGNVRDYPIPGPNGEIPVRIYTPDGGGPNPVLVWLHGGGWIRGSIGASDATCRALCNRLSCSVVSVGYRLAPEHPFPAGLEDCYAALRWAADNPDVTLGDGERLAVGGTSAGGNLSAAVSLVARDRGGPELDLQFLDVPVTDYAFDTRSYEENAEGYGLSRADMKYYWDHYVDDDVDAYHPYAAPLKARDLSGLPPAMVVTCGFDVLRDEGIAYAERLEQAGVPVNHLHYPDSIHAVIASARLKLEFEPAKRGLDDVVAGFEDAFGL